VLRVVKESVEAGEAGEDPIEVLGLAGGVGQIVGEHFEKGEILFSELLYASKIFKGIMEIIRPKLKKVFNRDL